MEWGALRFLGSMGNRNGPVAGAAMVEQAGGVGSAPVLIILYERVSCSPNVGL